MLGSCLKDQGSGTPANAGWVYSVTGTWDVSVTLRNCATGASLVTRRVVNTFSPCGALFETGTRTASNPGSPGQGSWRHVAGNNYAAVLRFFRFNHDGSVVETQKVTRRLDLSDDGMGFTGTAVGEVFDANDMLITANWATETANRFD